MCNPKPKMQQLIRRFASFLPGVRIYGHDGVVEAGMPYSFARVESKDGDVTVARLNETTPEVVPRDYARRWAEGRTTDNLRDLRTDTDVGPDVKQVINEELSRRAGKRK